MFLQIIHLKEQRPCFRCLVKALDFIQKIVVSGLPKGHTDKYCKVNAERKEKESYFELEILLNEKYYSYQ